MVDIGPSSVRRPIHFTTVLKIFIMQKCTEFEFGLGSAPEPTRELKELPQTPIWT